MSEQILAAATPEQRAILAPHVERLAKAKREMAETEVVIKVAMRALWPECAEPGVHYDLARGLVIRTQQEVTDGDSV